MKIDLKWSVLLLLASGLGILSGCFKAELSPSGALVVPGETQVSVGLRALGLSLSAAPGQSLKGNLVAENPNGSKLRFRIVSNSANARVRILDEALGTFEYVSNEGFTGKDAFQFSVTSGSGAISTALVEVNVTRTNRPPVGPSAPESLIQIVSEDMVFDGRLQATDPDGDSLEYRVASPSAHGTVELINAKSGLYRYTPDADFYGSDSVTFVVSDGKVDSAPITVSFTVLNIPDAPSALRLAQTVKQGQVVRGFLPYRDYDGNAQFVFSLFKPDYRVQVVLLNPNTGEYQYTAGSSVGDEIFYYFVTAGGLTSNQGEARITVSQNNLPPVAPAQTVLADQDLSKTFQLIASDPNGDSLSYSPTTGVTQSRGSVVLNANTGEATYTPPAGYFGADSFSYTVRDSELSASGLISIQVRKLNRAPIVPSCSQIQFEGVEDQALNLAFSASDPDGDALTYSISIGPSNGLGTIRAPLSNSDGRFVFDPAANANSDSGVVQPLSIVVSDGIASTTCNGLVKINGVNDPPIARNFSVLVDARQLPMFVQGFLANVTDVDQPGPTPLKFLIHRNYILGVGTLTSTGSEGDFVTSTTGIFSLTLNPEFAGTVVVPYRVRDAQGAESNSEVRLTVDRALGTGGSGASGQARLPVPDVLSELSDALVTADNRLVWVGRTSSEGLVSRALYSGSPDSSFGSQGNVVLAVPDAYSAYSGALNSATEIPSSRVLIAVGQIQAGTEIRPWMIALNANGSIQWTSVGGPQEAFRSVVLDSQNRLQVLGASLGGVNEGAVYLRTFDTQGAAQRELVFSPRSGVRNNPIALRLAANDKLWILWEEVSALTGEIRTFVVARLNTQSGVQESVQSFSFARNPVLKLTDIKVDDAGRVWLAGGVQRSNVDGFVMRLVGSSSLSVDAGFGTQGVYERNLVSGDDLIYRIALNGTQFLCAGAPLTGSSGGSLWAVNEDGRGVPFGFFDSSIGSTGAVSLISGARTIPLVLLKDFMGKIWLGGISRPASSLDLSSIRLKPGSSGFVYDN